MASDCKFLTNPQALKPYRSGSYLIFDYSSEDKNNKKDHFRRGDDPKLKGKTFRASGSRQLDVDGLTARLGEVAKEVKPGGRLHLVDLRQETHLFL